MRLVFLDTTLDSPFFGGAQTFLFKLMKELGNDGMEVHFITKGKIIPDRMKWVTDCGAILHTRLWPKSILIDEAALLLADWINALKPDVYIVSVSADIGWLVLPHLSPTIGTCAIGHSDSDTFYAPAKHYSKFLTRAIGVSDEICKKYVEISGMPKKNVAWIPYGVRRDENGPEYREFSKDRPMSMVYVGRMEDQQKRVSDLIGIILLLAKRELNFHFRIIGDGPLFGKLQKEFAPQILAGNVELTGWLNSDPLVAHLRNSDVFVLTSAYEGFCISLVEALAHSCCPVVTDIESGNRELVTDGVNGYLIPIGDVDEFAEKLAHLIANPQIVYEFRKKAWEVGRQYSIERMVGKFSECFDNARVEALEERRETNTAYPVMESCRSKYPAWLRRIKNKARYNF